MRWLMIALLVSLGVLLLAVAGVARHIRKHRSTVKRQAAILEVAEEAEIETEQ